MATKEEYAALSAIIYNNARNEFNKLTTLPAGWSPLSLDPSNSITGFTAAAFINDQSGEIVIAYKGTDSGDLVQMAQDFLTGNIPLALGGIPLPGYLSILSKFPAFQMYEAALFYEQVKMAAQIGANISFTGHSLGGGLASLMAVLFERQATTFAQAPFELTALNYGMISGLSDFLADNNFQDSSLPSSLLDYLNNYLPSYSVREAGVTNYVVPGEVLSKYLVMFPNIIGANHPIVVGGTEQIASDTLHSILLHTALLMSQTFENDTVLLTQLLTEIFDTNLYASPSLRGEIPDFLNHLLNDQIKVGYDNADGLLARFAADLDKLTQYSANLKDGALGKALIDIAIADYYFMQNGFSGRDFFTAITGGISFDLADIAANWSNNKTAIQLANTITQQYNLDLQARLFLKQDNAWTIQSGADALAATGTGSNNDAMIGGTANDTLDGGTGNDFLFGGDGTDTLTGGAGGDLLIGGAGADTLNGGAGYDTYTLEGRDTIQDSDGNGILRDKAGNILAGVIEKRADGTYTYLTNPSVSVTLDANFTLTLTLTDDTIAVIENFTSGKLGLQLADTATQAATLTLTGDVSPVDTDPAEAGIQAASNSYGNPLGMGMPYEDILYDSSGNDHILSGEQTDLVMAWTGDDWIEGGNGNDVLLDGLGNDLIEGGAGKDLIYAGDGNDRLYGNVQIDTATAITNGSNDTGSGNKGDWLAGQSGDDTMTAGADDDVLSGGGGNDMIIAGAGNDLIFGDSNVRAVYIMPGGTPRYSMSGVDYYSVSQDTFNWGYTYTNGVLDYTTQVAGEPDPADAGNDIIYASNGDDLIWAGAGIDVVYGENGADMIAGGAGNDILLAGSGDDKVWGGDGNDHVEGGTGNDTLYGDNGDGGTGDDTLIGGAGNDTLWGGDGSDTLIGGLGDDKLYGEAGSNTLDGGDGNDLLNTGGSGNSLFGGTGDDTLEAAGGGSTLDGEDGADTLTAVDGTNTLFGGAGDDTLSASGGDNYLDGEEGNNTLFADGGNNTLFAGAGNDTLAAHGGNNYLDGSDGANLIVTNGSGGNTLIGGTGADTLSAEGGNNYLDGGDGANLLTANGGGNTLIAGSGNDTLSSLGGNGYLDGGDGNDLLIADTGGNTLSGGAGDDTLSSAGGNSTLDGGDGADVLIADTGGNTLIGGAGDDRLSSTGGLTYLDGGDGADTLLADTGGNTLIGGAGDDMLYAGTGGNNYLDGGDGMDTYAFDAGFGTNHIADSGSGGGNVALFNFDFAGSGIVVGLGSLKLSFAPSTGSGQAGDVLHIDNFDPNDPSGTCSITTFQFNDQTLTLQEILDLGGPAVDFTRGPDITGTAGIDTLLGTDKSEHIYGLAGNDTIAAGGGNDSIEGGAGNDIIDGGAGADFMRGGAGSDTYVVDNAADYIVESINEGTDTVQSSVSHTLRDHFENLALTGFDNINGTGNELDNFLAGNDGNNLLSGGDGDDRIEGGAGDDRLDGGYGKDKLLGGTGADALDGGFGNDQLFGGADDDILSGGADNDVLWGEDGADTLTGGLGHDSLEGGAGNDVLEGGDGHDTLYSGAGADSMAGGAGDDTYTVDESGDTITEDSNSGTDTVKSAISYTLGDALENLYLQGTDNLDATGNALDNIIGGNAGVNTLTGGQGNDTYYVQNTGDAIVEGLDAGMDQVHSTASYTLSVNVENLTLTAGNINGTGNALDNVIVGSDGRNSLDGGAGADGMTGGYGDDTYYVDNAGDQVIESAVGKTYSSWGWLYTIVDTDTVNASVSYTLGANLENLNLTGTANIDGAGNELDNIINGNGGDNMLAGGAGNDVITGGAGADAMEGGAGNDTFYVDNAGDRVIETVAGQAQWWDGHFYSGDVEQVYSSVSFALRYNLENLTLTGIDNIDGAGNTLANVIIGNDGINALSGGLGDDTYYVQTAGDTVIEDAANGGWDQVYSSVDFTMGANVEWLILNEGAIRGTGSETDNRILGNAAGNALNGESGNDYVDGRSGDDVISGGAGDDTIYGGQDANWSWSIGPAFTNVDTLDGGDGNDYIDGGSGSDVISGGAGDDTLYGGDDGDGYELAQIFTGDDVIDGGAGNDFIDGGAGADTLLGGDGNDTIHGGITGQASFYDYATHGDVTVSSDDFLDGGAGDDILDGGSGADTLLGGAGNDILKGGAGLIQWTYNPETGMREYVVAENNDYLDGGAGIDVMSGEDGDDVYVVDGSYIKTAGAPVTDDCGDLLPAEALVWTTDTVIEYEEAGYDTVYSGASYTLTEEVEELRLTLDPALAAGNPQMYADLLTYGQDGTGNSLDNTIIGNELANRLDGGAGADYLEGGAGNDTYVVDEMDTVVENVTSGIDTVVANFSCSLLDTNLENLTLLDGALDGQGNAADNLLVGNAAANVLQGMDGNDKLTGGLGSDTLQGGAGDDRYVFHLGDGADVIDDWQGSDTLYIGSDLTTADVSMQQAGNDLLLSVNGTADSITLTNWYVQSEGVKRVEFCDGGVLWNNSPVAANPIPGQLTNEDEAYSFTIPADAFSDADFVYGDTLTYTVALSNGNPLPSWLSFDAATQTFSGTPDNGDVDSFNVTVTATDSGGLSASSDFVLEVLNMNDAPAVANLLADQSAFTRQAFSFVAAGGPAAVATASFLNDATDTGTPEQVWAGYQNGLYGSGGNDTYTFSRGDGHVHIYDWDNSPMDTVQFTDLLPGDITVTQDQWGGVNLSVNGTGDSLYLGSWLYSDFAKVEQVAFADGTVWGVNDIQAMLSTAPAAGSDYITGTDGNDTVYALAGDDGVLAGTGDDTVIGGAGNDYLYGGGGSDILSGGSGADSLEADWDLLDTSNDLLMGGSGDDDLWASASSDMLIGGTGNDYIGGYDGSDVILFNRGDGNDRIDPWSNDAATRPDTVSLGGGITYADLSFSRDADTLVLNVGNGESISFENWFYGQEYKVVAGLQVISEAMPGYDQNTSDQLLNKRIQQFDFLGMANQFEAALAADSAITAWQLAPHLAGFSLGGSDTAAIGGDVAYLYGKNGNLDGLSEADLRAQLTDAGFGAGAQTLTAISSDTFADVDAIHGDTLTYSAMLAGGKPLPGWLNFDPATRTFSGTPANGDAGILSVAVIATDSGGLSATSVFNLDVIILNTAPIAVPDMVAISEDDGISTVAAAGLLANDIDPDAGDTLTIAGFDAVSAQGNAVSLDVNGNIALDIGDNYQSLGAGQTVTDSFAYTVTDMAGEMSTATVAITIAGVNDAPVTAILIADRQTDEDAPFSFAIPANTFTDIDNGDVLTYNATLADGTALPDWLSFDDATQTFSGMPLNDDVGNLNVLITATDTGGLSASSSFALNAINVNDTPTANADAGTAIEDGGAVTLNAATLLANDTDPDAIHGDVLNIVGVTQADSCAAVSLINGAVQYDIGKLFQSLAQGQKASDTFSYTVSDTAGATSIAQVTMTITGANDAPVTAADMAVAQEDLNVSATGNVLSNDSDVDQGAVLSVHDAGLRSGNYGQLTLDADGTYAYALDNTLLAVQSLAAGQTVTDTFVYQATDGMIATPSTLTVTITGTNDAPVAAIPLTGQAATETGAFNYQLPPGAFTDIDQGDKLTYTATLSNPSAGSGQAPGALPSWLIFDANTQAFSSTLPDGAAGLWGITVTATDTIGASATGAFTLDVANLIKGSCEEDKLTGTSLRDVIYGLGENDKLGGGNAGDVLVGGSGNDVLEGGAGDDILIGGIPASSSLAGAPVPAESACHDNHGEDSHHDDEHGDSDGHDSDDEDSCHDDEHDKPDNNLLNGGAGNDTLIGGGRNDLLIGGTGNDTLETGNGADIIAFNRGDGQDTVVASTGQDNTLSLGGGTRLGDLAFSHAGNDLILETGASEQITFLDWYASLGNHSIASLQIIGNDLSASTSGKPDNKTIRQFDFDKLVASYDQAVAANSTTDHWALTNVLLDKHLEHSSGGALGGDLAWQYGMNGSLAMVSLNAAQDVLDNSSFGIKAQHLHKLSSSKDGVAMLG